MCARWWYAVLRNAVAGACGATLFVGTVCAQEVVGEGWVNVPALGPVDLNTLPPDVAANIRIPGETYDDEPTADDIGAAAAGVLEPEPVAPGSTGSDSRPDAPLSLDDAESDLLTAPEPLPPKDEEEQAAREAAKDFLNEREKFPRDSDAAAEKEPLDTPPLPEDAYIRAQEQAETLNGDVPLIIPEPEPQSHFFDFTSTLASVLSPAPASAQVGQCASMPAWAPVGPAPFDFLNTHLMPPSIAPSSGILKAITLQPTNPSIIHVGSRGGGLWTTTTGGTSWSTFTDNLPSPNKTSLHIETIVVDGSVVLAGTGIGSLLFDGSLFTTVNRSIGTLRNKNSGFAAPYEQVGPTWCVSTDSACRNGAGACTKADPALCPGTNPTNSTINIRRLAVDKSTSTTRIWAATSMGLWWSETALTVSTPANVQWTLVTPPGSCSSGCLPSATTSTPAQVNNILVSPLRGPAPSSAFILYASVHGASSSAANGWYRSDNRGASWAKVGNICTNCSLANPSGCVSCLPPNMIYSAAIFPGATASDTIYTMVDQVPGTGCSGGIALGLRIYRTTNSGATWSLVDTSLGGTCEGSPCNPNCERPISLQVHPVDPNRFVLGQKSLWEASNVGSPSQVIRRILDGIVHADHNALTYHSTNPDILYDANDGGIWSINMTASPTFTFRHGNLANIEFYTGALSPLNYGASYGGTQDNGNMKTGSLQTSTQSVWRTITGGDGFEDVLIDPRNSNVEYHNQGLRVRKTVNGGKDPEFFLRESGLAVAGVANVKPLAGS